MYHNIIKVTTPSLILPVGWFNMILVGGAGGGGGVAAGLSAYSVAKTSVGKSNTDTSGAWLHFPDTAWALSNNWLAQGMTVSGPGVTGYCGVGRVSGSYVEIISYGGTITYASVTSTGTYTFNFNQAGAGGSASNPHHQVIYSDGATPFVLQIGTKGLGGVGGNPGGAGSGTFIYGGADNINTFSPPGCGGDPALTTKLAYAGNPSGPNLVEDPLARISFFLPGGGGAHAAGPKSFQGCAAAEVPVFGPVGGGAGGLAIIGSTGGGGGGQGLLSNGGGPGITPAQVLVSAPSSPAGGPYTLTVSAGSALTLGMTKAYNNDILYVKGEGITGLVQVLGINTVTGVLTLVPDTGSIVTNGLTLTNYIFCSSITTTGSNGFAAIDPHFGCGGGGAGQNADATALAANGGDAGPGCAIFWR